MIGAQLYLTEVTKPPVQYPVVSLTSVFSILGGTVALAVASLSTLYGINWRNAFWFGGIVAVVGIIARSTLKETPDFSDAKKRTFSALNDSQKEQTIKSPIWQENINKDRKTFISLFIMDCGWPICFYFAYIFCGDILKRDFGFTAEQVIHQNFIVSIVQLLCMLILSFLSYRIYPPKIVKVKLLIFILTVFFGQVLILVSHTAKNR